MKHKPPMPLSNKQAKLMERIISEQGPLIHELFESHNAHGIPDFAADAPLEWLSQAEWLSGLAIGIGVALKWFEEHPDAGTV